MIRGPGILTTVVMLATAALAASTMQPLPRADTPPGPGIPRALAEERARRIRDLRYDLHFSIPAERTSPIAGRVTVAFVLQGATRPLALDFASSNDVRSVRSGTKTIAPVSVPDHLVIPAADLREGRNEIVILFRSAMDYIRATRRTHQLLLPSNAAAASMWATGLPEIFTSA